MQHYFLTYFYTQTNEKPLFPTFVSVFYICKFVTYIELTSQKNPRPSLECCKNANEQSWEKRLALACVLKCQTAESHTCTQWQKMQAEQKGTYNKLHTSAYIQWAFSPPCPGESTCHTFMDTPSHVHTCARNHSCTV